MEERCRGGVEERRGAEGRKRAQGGVRRVSCVSLALGYGEEKHWGSCYTQPALVRLLKRRRKVTDEENRPLKGGNLETGTHRIILLLPHRGRDAAIQDSGPLPLPHCF